MVVYNFTCLMFNYLLNIIFQQVLHHMMYMAFSILSTVLIMNFVISMLNVSIQKVKDVESLFSSSESHELPQDVKDQCRDPIDRQLGSYVWEKIEAFVASLVQNKQIKEPVQEGNNQHGRLIVTSLSNML